MVGLILIMFNDNDKIENDNTENADSTVAEHTKTFSDDACKWQN